MSIRVGDRVKFTRNAPRPWDIREIEGTVVSILTNKGGASRYRIRTDDVSPQDGEQIEWLVWSHEWRISNAAN